MQKDFNSNIKEIQKETEELLNKAKEELEKITNSIKFYKKPLDIFITFTDCK